MLHSLSKNCAQQIEVVELGLIDLMLTVSPLEAVANTCTSHVSRHKTARGWSQRREDVNVYTTTGTRGTRTRCRNALCRLACGCPSSCHRNQTFMREHASLSGCFWRLKGLMIFPLAVPTETWHMAYSCSGECLRQFCFSLSTSLRLGLVGRYGTEKQTDGQTDGRVDKTRNAACQDGCMQK